MSSCDYGEENSSSEVPVDIWRDTHVRLLGYANEVGEAFRALVPLRLVHFSYGVAFSYVIADTLHKTSQVKKERSRMVTAADTLIWQTFASVVIPGFTINRVCALSLLTLKSLNKFGPQQRKYITTAIGLASIPIIFKPIDSMVDYVMDNTFRKHFHTPPGIEPIHHRDE